MLGDFAIAFACINAVTRNLRSVRTIYMEIRHPYCNYAVVCILREISSGDVIPVLPI